MQHDSPYRGILLYHGLGVGKTCASIAIAEGFQSPTQIVIMTPASLQMNYREELKNGAEKEVLINPEDAKLLNNFLIKLKSELEKTNNK